MTASNEINPVWVFEHYCHLPVSLTGQTQTVCSVFKEERTPSMKIFLGTHGYMFNDFSTGKSGSCIALVRLLFNLDSAGAYTKIREDYANYLSNGGTAYAKTEYVKTDGYRITDYKKRQWNIDDQKYWVKYNICSALLKYYNIFPLESYYMDGAKGFEVKSTHLYGFFNSKGELTRLYQPKNRKKKFIVVDCNYIQGSEQLDGNDIMLWNSSMKDILSVRSLNIPNIDQEASNSENSFFSLDHFNLRSGQYKYLFTLLNYDKAGMDAAKEYQKRYGIIPLLIPISKDPSDSIMDTSPEKVRESLIISINKAIQLVDASRPVAIAQTNQLTSLWI